MEHSTGRGRPACGANSLSGSCVFIQLSKLIILKIEIFKIQPFKVLYLRASSYLEVLFSLAVVAIFKIQGNFSSLLGEKHFLKLPFPWIKKSLICLSMSLDYPLMRVCKTLLKVSYNLLFFVEFAISFPFFFLRFSFSCRNSLKFSFHLSIFLLVHHKSFLG